MHLCSDANPEKPKFVTQKAYMKISKQLKQIMI